MANNMFEIGERVLIVNSYNRNISQGEAIILEIDKSSEATEYVVNNFSYPEFEKNHPSGIQRVTRHKIRKLFKPVEPPFEGEIEFRI